MLSLRGDAGLSCVSLPPPLPGVLQLQVCLACLQCWLDGVGGRSAAETILLALGLCAAMNYLELPNGPSWALTTEGQLLLYLVSLGHH